MVHPKYERGKPYFDVAVLVLDPPVNISGTYVRPICLPNASSTAIDEFDGHQMDVAGQKTKQKNCAIFYVYK